MTQNESRNGGVDPWRVGGAIAFAILFLPYSLGGGGNSFQITSGLWWLMVTPYVSSFEIWTPANPLLFLFLFPQFLFMFQMVRLYEGKTTGRRTFVVWFLGVLIMIVMFVGNTLPLLWDPTWPYAFNPVVIPSSFLVAVLLVRFYPPPRETIPWKGTKPWWKRA